MFSKLIKKLFLIFFFGVLTCLSGLCASAEVKITNVSFDNSAGFMFLSAVKTTEETTTEINSMSLKNPDRTFFDISNAILTQPNESWYFKGSDISQIKVSQFSTNPNTVRIVFYHSEKFNPQKISVMNIKGNFLFKYGDIQLKQKDFYTAFRTEHNSPDDYLEKTVYIPASEVAKTPVNQSLAALNTANIQKAFSSVQPQATTQATTTSTASTTTANTAAASANTSSTAPIDNYSWGKIFKLRTNFFLSRVDIKRGNILLLGSGRAAIENPIYLSNPTRVVFDMPNTMVVQKFKNVEIQLSETETLKVGQFEPSKVRLVITTSSPKAYRPIFSGDGQGILISHDSRLSGIKLYEKGAQTLKTTVTKQNDMTNVFKVEYAFPVVYSVKQNDNKLELMVYNATGFNEEFFKTAIKGTKLESAQGSKMNIGGVKYVFSLPSNSNFNVLSREDGKQLQVVIQNTKQSISSSPKPTIQSNYKGSGLIIIDPGHGGADTGALRDNINEKDITLEVSKKVAHILTKKGYKADLTRWDDKTLSLQERVDISDSRKASVFVSIHVNSSINTEPEGIETHWWTENGYKLANIVHNAFADKVKVTNRGLVKSKFYVINHTQASSILVEIGFLSNDNERKELLTKERQDKTAEGIAEGIIKFMKKEGIK